MKSAETFDQEIHVLYTNTNSSSDSMNFLSASNLCMPRQVSHTASIEFLRLNPSDQSVGYKRQLPLITKNVYASLMEIPCNK